MSSMRIIDSVREFFSWKEASGFAHEVVEMVQVKVGDFLCHQDEDGRYLGILNYGKYKEGDRVVGMVGGSAKILDYAPLVALGATDFDKDGDAKFAIPRKCLSRVAHILDDPKQKVFQDEIEREIEEELGTMEFEFQIRPVLRPKSLASLHTKHKRTHVYEHKGVYHICDVHEILSMSKKAIKDLHSEINSSVIHWISPEELRIWRGKTEAKISKKFLEIARSGEKKGWWKRVVERVARFVGPEV